MKLKHLILALTISTFSINSFAASPKQAEMDKFINNLMSKMTLHEKLGQLNLEVAGDIVTGNATSSNVGQKIASGEIGGVFNLRGVERIRELQEVAVKKSRLGIPLIVGMDVIHGHETVFPVPLALSCTWDMDAIKRVAQISATEAAADGINWTFSPMVDISREPRWGRVVEGSGEDPYLGSCVARAMVEGYQGDDLAAKNTVAACVKHFALYGAPDAGRDYNTVDMSAWRMFNYYMPPYKAAIDAGALTVMTSFNVVNGIPATGNKWLLSDVLRKQWHFDGMVVTDYSSIAEMISHGMGDLKQVSELAMNAGVDMDMMSFGFMGPLEQSVADGKVSLEAINQACRRVLEAKYRLGLFDDPYRYCDVKRAKKMMFTAENRAEARRIAAETFVLLKNDRQQLPLKRQGKIALIGPMGNEGPNLSGTWCVAARFDENKTLFQAMKDAVGDKAEVLYAKGSNILYDEKIEENGSMMGSKNMRDPRSVQVLLNEALEVAEKCDVIVAAIGESAEFSGESASRTDLSIFDAQKDLLTALKKTGKPIVLVNFSGRPTVMTWESQNFDAILNVWFGGSEAADAICDVLFGDKSPCGKLTATMPKAVGQIPIYYNHLNTGRPVAAGRWFAKYASNYLDVDNEPLYPFGYGLTYSQFTYGKPSISSTQMAQDGSVTLTVDVTNSGNYDADEIVQLYVRDLVGSVSRPVKELKGFKREHFAKGETKTIAFTITADDLKFYDSELNYRAEPGEFDIMVGPNSRDVQTLRFTLQ